MIYLAADIATAVVAALGLLRLTSGPAIDRIHNHRATKGD